MKKIIYIIILLNVVLILNIVLIFRSYKLDPSNESITLNKSVIFFGDSITYGTRGTPVGYSWVNYIDDNYDFKECINAGKAGWLISHYYNKKSLINTMFEYKDKSFDYVILQGGTNDITKNTPLGDYKKDDFSGNYDTDTFIGGLERYIYIAKKYWPNAKIGYIINYRTPNNNKYRVHLSVVYYSKMKEVLKKWDVAYLNLYNGKTEDNKYFDDLLLTNTEIYLVDTLHLNKEGYEVIYPYIYSWIEKL